MWTPNVVLFRESTRSVFAPNSVICVFKDEPLPNRSTENEVTLFVDMETGETAIDPPDSLAVREVSFDCHSVRASVDPIVPDSLEEDKAFQNFLLRGQDLRGKIDHLLSLWSTVPVPETSELGRWERESSALDQEEAFVSGMFEFN